ncbi:uncharacterized protein BJX67DRAFT_362764 [Aspergillus lucknowensis]|uniref:Uncharacterized protein n=1 Tax=Aspergillus lucknowensis TaxID=176173 RepID=A0ABR4LHH1_9EURO
MSRCFVRSFNRFRDSRDWTDSGVRTALSPDQKSCIKIGQAVWSGQGFYFRRSSPPALSTCPIPVMSVSTFAMCTGLWSPLSLVWSPLFPLLCGINLGVLVSSYDKKRWKSLGHSSGFTTRRLHGSIRVLRSPLRGEQSPPGLPSSSHSKLLQTREERGPSSGYDALEDHSEQPAEDQRP